MRWERLFADLEAEADELAVRERDAAIAERTRAELATVRLLDRLRGSTGRTVTVRVLGGDVVRGRVGYVGPDWLLVHPDGPEDVLVPAHALAGVDGVSAVAAPDPERVPLSWAAAWRRLSRDRVDVRVVRTDGSQAGGLLGRVGADFAEVGTTLLPWSAVRVAHVRREPG